MRWRTLHYSHAIYDDSGNLAQRTDPRVTTTFSAYDGMNRVTGKSYNDGTTPAVGYAYYPPATTGSCAILSQGRLMSVTAGAMANNYLCYDVMGRVTSSSQATAGVTYPAFSYGYDKSGALASVTYPSGRTVTNTFDVAGRINQVSGPSNKNYASSVAYAPQGAIQSLTLFNGVAETWGFNTRQQPTSLQALGQNASLNLTWTYGADSSNNGNVMTQAITRSAGLPAPVSQTYQYTDPSNRLSFAIEPNLPNYGGWWQTYNYDAFGNRAIPSVYYTPNPDQTPAALTEFTVNRWKRGNGDGYDGSGNQTAVATRANPGASVNFFTYDGENRMVTSNVASMGTVTYSYDGEGRRVQKSWSCSVGNGTCSTAFVYDAMGQLAAEYSTAPNPASGTEYLTADSLGSTRLVTDGSGAVTQCYDYLPFGEEIPQGINGRGNCYPPSAVYPHTADATSRKFTGKERDVETGLDYFGARYMSSAQGRFTSPDPKMFPRDIGDPQSWNKYGYTRNNPVQYVDPDGEDWVNPTMSALPDGSINTRLLDVGAGALKSLGRTAVSILRAMGADENLMDRASSALIPSNARQEMVMKLTDFAQDAEGAKSLVAGGILVIRNPLALGEEITRLGRNITNNFKSLDADHIRAATRELAGEVVKVNPRDGQAYDHVTEVRNAAQGLVNSTDRIKRMLGDPNLTGKARGALETQLRKANRKLDELREAGIIR